MIGRVLHGSQEGSVEVRREGEFPAISPNRRGIRLPLAAYLALRRHDP